MCLFKKYLRFSLEYGLQDLCTPLHTLLVITNYFKCIFHYRTTQSLSDLGTDFLGEGGLQGNFCLQSELFYAADVSVYPSTN